MAGFAAANDSTGQQLFQRCAACHLPDGAGVPGAFPPLAGRLAPLAASTEGREYLVLVVDRGLAGPITVDGTAYNGAMPAQAPALDNDAIAAVLNYVVSIIGADREDRDLMPFTAEEIDAILARHSDATNAVVHQMRAGAWATVEVPN